MAVAGGGVALGDGGAAAPAVAAPTSTIGGGAGPARPAGTAVKVAVGAA
ncbi:MAG TPA: hypothetical protein VGL23_19550 [Chloroflexota bacterium]